MDSLKKPIRNKIYNEFMMESSRWDNFEARDGDIVICTPAKCGTTWTQMICALLIFQKTEFDKPLTEHSPWLDVLTAATEDVLTQLKEQSHRRFIKTHTPLDGLPYLENTKYICVGRDPRDAFVSLKHHMENMTPEIFELCKKYATEEREPPQPAPEDLREWFSAWIGSSCSTDPGHAAHADVLGYVKSFWEFRHLPNILMLHYSDLKSDLEGEMKRLAEFLDIEVPDSLWPELVAAASFESMKNKADQLAPQVTSEVWIDASQFFKSGTNGQWQELLGADQIALYQQVMAERLDPDLANWLESGRIVSGIN